MRAQQHLLVLSALLAVVLLVGATPASGNKVDPPNVEAGVHPNPTLTAAGAVSLSSGLASSNPGFGCLRGYCWSYCIGGIPWWGVEWCWTSKNGQWASSTACSSDSDCGSSWRCSSACTV